jgi:hypothetical protein
VVILKARNIKGGVAKNKMVVFYHQSLEVLWVGLWVVEEEEVHPVTNHHHEDRPRNIIITLHPVTILHRQWCKEDRQ